MTRGSCLLGGSEGFEGRGLGEDDGAEFAGSEDGSEGGTGWGVFGGADDFAIFAEGDAEAAFHGGVGRQDLEEGGFCIQVVPKGFEAMEGGTAQAFVIVLDVLAAHGDLLIGAMARDGFAEQFDALDFCAKGLGEGLGKGGVDEVEALLLFLDALAWHVEEAAESEDFDLIFQSVELAGDALPHPLGCAGEEGFDLGMFTGDAFGGGAGSGGSEVCDEVGDGGIGFMSDGGDDGDV